MEPTKTRATGPECEIANVNFRSDRRSKWALAASACLTIGVGALIYILYAPMTLLVFDWTANLGLSTLVLTMREHAVGTAPPFHQSIPDGLWVYASTLLLGIPWVGVKFHLEVATWLGLPMVLAVAAEVGQATGHVSGTFDPKDLIGYVLGGCVAYLQVVRTNQ